MKKLIVFTGGHYNSTLEVAKIAKRKGYRTLWLGIKYNLSSKQTLSPEYREVRQEGITFKALNTGRFYKKINLIEMIKILSGFFQSFYYLAKYKPNLIYSSGGYVSVPVVISGYLLGIPSVTHEQTVISGWANKAITPFVRRIFLTYDDIYHQYPKNKSVVTGLPLNTYLTSKGGKSVKKSKRKTIFLTSGKQGSEIINNSFFPLVAKLAKKYRIIHQTGPNSLLRANQIKESLGKDKKYYTFAEYFFAKDQAHNLKNSDLVISRSGAHTAYELIYLNKNSIVIPIPWVSHQEQLLNAKYAKSKINCDILEEKYLNPSTLENKINERISIKNSSQKNITTANSTEKIFRELEAMALV